MATWKRIKFAGEAAGSFSNLEVTGNTELDGQVTIGGDVFLTQAGNVALELDSTGGGSSRLKLNSKDANGEHGEFFFQTAGATKAKIYHHKDGILYLQTGGTTTALTLDASQNATFAGRVSGTTAGGFYLKESTSNAFSIKSNGANGYLLFRDEYNSADRLKIEQSGQLSILGSMVVTGSSTFYNHVYVASDTKKIYVGASNDFMIGHDGSHTYLENSTGELRIVQSSGDHFSIWTDPTGSGTDTKRFNIAPTGLATFYGEITVAGGNDYSATFQNDVKIIDSGSNPRLLLGDDTGGTGYGEINWHSSNNSIQLGTATAGANTLILDQSGNATFAGHVTLANTYALQWGDSGARIEGNTSTDTVTILTGGTSALTINSSQNATFAGAVTSSTLTTTGSAYIGDNLSMSGGQFYVGGNVDGGWRIYKSGTDLVFGNRTGSTWTDHRFYINNVGNATFAGTIDSGAITVTSASDPILTLNKTGGANSAIHFEAAGSAKGYIYVNADKTMTFGNVSVNPTLTINPTGNATFAGSISLPDNGTVNLGTGSDFQLWHNGTHSYTYSETGNMYYQQNSAGASHIFETRYGGGSKSSVFEVTDGGIQVTQGNATFAGIVKINAGASNWNETTPGTNAGSIHLDPGVTTDHYGSAITWGASDTGDGETAQAGIYVRSDGGYGTKMYLATTGNYGAGSTTALTISSDQSATFAGAVTTSGLLTVNNNVVLNVGTGNNGLIMKPTGAGSTTLRLDTYADNSGGRNWAFRNRYSAHGRFELMHGGTNTADPLTVAQYWTDSLINFNKAAEFDSSVDIDGTLDVAGLSTFTGDIKVENIQSTGTQTLMKPGNVTAQTWWVSGSSGLTKIEQPYFKEYLYHHDNATNYIRFTTDAIAISANATFSGDVRIAADKTIILDPNSGNIEWLSEGGTRRGQIVADGNGIHYETGTSPTRIFSLPVAGTSLRMSSDADIIWETDNVGDIGASGATRPRDLHLGRNAVIGGDVSIAPTKKLYLDSGGNTYIQETQDDYVSFYVNQKTAIRLTEGGLVGLGGTSNPFYAVGINVPFSGGYGSIHCAGSTTGSHSGLQSIYRPSLGGGRPTVGGRGSEGGWEFYHDTSSQEAVMGTRIQGGASPRLKFYYAGGDLEFGTIPDATADGSLTTRFTLGEDGNATFSNNITVGTGQILTPSGVNLALNPNTGTVSVGGVINATGTGTNTFSGVLTINNKLGINTSSPASWDGEGDDFVIYNTATPGMTIATNSTTGRGSILWADGTTGSEKYRGGITYDHGTGVSGSTVADSMYFRTAATINMALTGAGKVGIGTMSPSTILHIKGAGDKFRVDASDGTQILQIQEQTGQIADIIGAGNKDIYINKNSSGDVALAAGGGNVGIGTTSPDSQLNLSQANGSNIRFDNETTSRYFVVGEGVGTNDVFSFRGLSYRSTDTLSVDFVNNRVGVNKINPSYTLEVDGTFKATGNATFGGTVAIEESSSYGSFAINYNDGTNTCYIRNDGNNGFGISASNSGVAKQLDLRVHDGSGGSVLTFNTSGNATFSGTINSGAITATGSSNIDYLVVGNDQTTPRLIIDASGYGLYFGGDTTGNYIYNNTTSRKISIGVNSSRTDLVITNGGLIGIGTASPDSTLHVHTDNAGTWSPPAYGDDLVIENSADTGMSIVSPDGNSSYLLFGSPSRTGQYNAIVYSGYGGGSEYLAMNTYQGGEVMRLTHQGNVGIGTTSPDYPLTVAQDGHFQMAILGRGSSGQYATLDLMAGKGSIASPADYDTEDGILARIRIGAWESGSDRASVEIRGYAGTAWTGGNWDSDLAFLTTEAATTSTTEKMRITGDGKVGIGETVPLGKVHIFTGDSTHTGAVDTGADEFVIESNLDAGMTILSGTGYKGGIYFSRAGQNTSGSINYHHVNDSPANAMVFSTASTTALTLDSSQNATFTGDITMAQSSGDVIFRMDNNASNGADFTINNGAGNSRVDFTVDNNQHMTLKGQKVGILTNNPTETLTVNGNGSFGGDVALDGMLNIYQTSSGGDFHLEGIKIQRASVAGQYMRISQVGGGSHFVSVVEGGGAKGGYNFMGHNAETGTPTNYLTLAQTTGDAVFSGKITSGGDIVLGVNNDLYIGDTQGSNTINDGGGTEMVFATDGTTALTIDDAQDSTFAGEVTASKFTGERMFLSNAVDFKGGSSDEFVPIVRGSAKTASLTVGNRYKDGYYWIVPFNCTLDYVILVSEVASVGNTKITIDIDGISTLDDTTVNVSSAGTPYKFAFDYDLSEGNMLYMKLDPGAAAQSFSYTLVFVTR